MINRNQRTAIAALVLSASGLIYMASNEGFIWSARPPVPGDVETAGFGSTRNEAGQPFRHGEKVDPVRGLILLKRDAGSCERTVKRCAPVPMFQHEFNVFVDHCYNVGETNFCGSSMARKLRAENYQGACDEFLAWKYFQKHDCSLPENQKLCGGLWTRRQKSRAICLGKDDA